MPKFNVAMTARATIVETWEVEAGSPAEAVLKVRQADAKFVEDEVLGDEEDRQLYRIENLDDDWVMYEDELAAIDAQADEME